ncbi:transcriptional repressor, partial [Streptomyces sp. NPDC048279]|uniref:transcriptional repressor n=1 Tax=Streptomyces sp. NPDC048279 TaxID=3154714 RepID=UPI00344ABD19
MRSVRIGAARAAAGGLSRQGLCNVLDDPAEAELVRCIESAGSPARYELRAGDNHRHLVCRRCGLIEDVGWLLQDLSDVTLEAPTEEREEAILSGGA